MEKHRQKKIDNNKIQEKKQQKQLFRRYEGFCSVERGFIRFSVNKIDDNIVNLNLIGLLIT